MKLEKLINSLKSTTFKDKFRLDNLDKLIVKLEEMNSMIEMEDVKNSFVSQLMLILMMRRQGCSPPFKKMHTVLSGPPGVGKTSMSILIAQIWDILKIMDKTLPSAPISPFLIKDCDFLSPTPSMLEPILSEVSISYKRDIAHIMTEVLDKISDIMMEIDKEHSDTDVDKIPEFIKKIYSKGQDSADLCQEIIDKYSKYFIDLDEPEVKIEKKDHPIPYVVLGRGDFVGTYQGHTSVKTDEILKSHKGKVIIIEEAYSLFTDDRDSYGMEALTIINRYMDEHADDYIFIFNGYTDKLDSSIFKAQPGLKRRIQWTFNIEKYTGEGIFRIFLHQLNRHNNPKWKICDNDMDYFRDFFHKNKKWFPNYGGDTEKLILFLQLEFGEFYFECHKNFGYCELNSELLDKAFERFKKMNNIKLSNDDLPQSVRDMFI